MEILASAPDRAASRGSGIEITIVNTISLFCGDHRPGMGQSESTAGGVDIYYYLSGHIALYLDANM